MTPLEYDVLVQCQKDGYKYIVRDKSKQLYAYTKAPVKCDDYWAIPDINHFSANVDDFESTEDLYTKGQKQAILDKTLFEFILWTDDAPTLISTMLEQDAVISFITDISEKIKQNIGLTPAEVEQLITQFEVERLEDGVGRWTKYVASICKINNKQYLIKWEEGLVGCHQNQYYSQIPVEVEKVEKQITITD